MKTGHRSYIASDAYPYLVWRSVLISDTIIPAIAFAIKAQAAASQAIQLMSGSMFGIGGVETEATQAVSRPVERAGHRPAVLITIWSVVVHADRYQE